MMMWTFLLIRGMSTLFFDTRIRSWRKEGLIPMQSVVEFFYISVLAVPSFSGKDFFFKF